MDEWISDIPSTSKLGEYHDIGIDVPTKEVWCSCKGFQVHKRCKHIRFYKPLINAILKSGDRKSENSAERHCRASASIFF